MTIHHAPHQIEIPSSIPVDGRLEIQAPLAEVASIPGLVRMVLVDTKLFPGAIAEVPLDGNTLVTGTNAAGKTSIIQLLPLFYGVSPSKISNKKQGKSFYGHYLPRSTSYVAFEYRHRDGSSRSVIVHAAQSEDKPMYRFVRSALFEEMFVGEDNEFIASHALAGHLRNRGYEVADRIIDTLDDYLTVIQGRPVRSNKAKDQRFLAQMVSQYSVSQLRSPLTNMDRVVYSMLKKDVSLQALEEMIARKILENDAEIQVDADRQKLENWPLRYRAYQDVMSKEEAARRLDRKCAELAGHQDERRAAISELIAAKAGHARDEAAARGREADLVSGLKKEADEYAERKEQATASVDEATRERNKHKDEIDEIKEIERSKKALGIETKVALADRKAEIEADRDDAKARLEALSGAQGELTAAYRDLKEQATAESYAEREAIQEEEHRGRAAHHDALAASDVRREAAEESARRENEEPIRKAKARNDAAIEAVGAARQAARSPQVSQETLNRRDEARRMLDEQSTVLNASLREEKGLEGEVRSKEKARDDIQAEVAGIETRIAALEVHRDQLRESRKPKPGTLLAYLRENREDWGLDIGRVINPALLHRHDLNPEMKSSGDEVFGLHLDLSSVDAAPEANLSGIDDAIGAAEAEIAELVQNAGKVRKRLPKAEEDHVSARRSLSDQQARQALLEKRLEAMRETLSAREADVARERELATKAAEDRVAEAERELVAARAAVAEAQAELGRALNDLKNAFRAEREAIEATLRDVLSQCRRREADSKARLGRRLEELDAELAQALAEKGVDPKVMEGLQARLKGYEADLASIRRNDSVVQEWRHFVATKLPKLPELQSSLEADEIALKRERAKDEELRKAWRSREGNLKTGIEAARRAIGDANRAYSLIERRLSGVDTDGMLPALSTARSTDEAIADLNEAEKLIAGLLREIRDGVIQISKVFLEQTGSPAEQHLTARKATFSTTVEGPEWVPALIEWFDTLHQQHRDNLLGDGRMLANSVKSAYWRLMDLDKRIQAENRTLQSHLNKNNVIAVVQDLNVSITSSISKLDFMPAMNRLSKLHEQWVLSGQVEPPEGFTEAVANLLTFWHSRSGISANLRDEIRLEGYVIENGNRRDFHARTDLTDISSNGVSYLILATILAAFVNMVRGRAPVHVVWALDELGTIDAENTRRLLDMLGENHITMVAATPSASASVNRLFDYRLKVIDGPRLADIRGAGRSSQRLLSNPERNEARGVDPDSAVAPAPAPTIDDAVTLDPEI